MDEWQLAEKLYAAGYSHGEVRDVWAYARAEQVLPQVGRKRFPWEALALDEIGVGLDEIEFRPTSRIPNGRSNYF